MTTEEIEKAARDYVDISIDAKQIYSDIGLVKSAAMVDFMEGVEFANKHWQEKTRWIPIKERLPELRKTPYWVVVKNEKGYDYACVNIISEVYFEHLKLLFTHWKEIE